MEAQGQQGMGEKLNEVYRIALKYSMKKKMSG
jgi:hypothetical protein